MNPNPDDYQITSFWRKLPPSPNFLPIIVCASSSDLARRVSGELQFVWQPREFRQT